MRRHPSFPVLPCLPAILILAWISVFRPSPAPAAEEARPASLKTFSLFSVLLPEGWSGEEDFGFHGGDDREYRLVLLKKGDSSPDAQVTVFLIPNERKEGAAVFAGKMAELQDNVTPVAEEDGFQAFTGEMRSRITRGPCRTRVRATEDRVLIVIVGDPAGVGAEEVFRSLRGVTPEAAELLGRGVDPAPAASAGTPGDRAGAQQ